jgi:poly-gamma-glutamate synthase PgsB/CapB
MLLAIALLLLAYLVAERIILSRRLRRIPLRICVTGTRGKTSVTRMLASVLRCDGRIVLAKTTGSEARFILPDGSEAVVPRSAPASILEQKRLVRKAAQLKVDCMVAEIMSIQPETHRVESHQLLRPHIVAVTNVRRDHTDEMGDTEEEIARVLSATICRQTTVFIPEGVPLPAFRERVRHEAGRLIPVARNESVEPGRHEFRENTDVVVAVARHLGIDDEIIHAGIRATRYDAGRFRVWSHRPGTPPCTLYLVSAFAANDPESTFRVLSRVRELFPVLSGAVVGVLNLRNDRIPRTLQWVDTLNREAAGWFQRIYLTGNYPSMVRRRLATAVAANADSPAGIMKTILAAITEDTVVFGFGNFAGMGRDLAEHWAAIGVDYGV